MILAIWCSERESLSSTLWVSPTWKTSCVNCANAPLAVFDMPMLLEKGLDYSQSGNNL